jgi:CBS domain containing-hemolysin-like protein
MGLKELFEFVAEGRHTRYPVHEDDDVDRIVGAVHVRDVLRAVKAAGDLDEADTTARNLARQVLVVPESRRVDQIMKDFREQEIHLAVVIDEWGSFEGVITLEDTIEEIVGEIRDEFDEGEPAVRELDEAGAYSMEGSVPIREVNEYLNTDFESEDFDTIGGLVLGRLGRAPEIGDEVVLDGHVLRVEEVDGSRVARVTVREVQE